MSDENIFGKALASLGKGFDLTQDFDLNFCKGEVPLVHLDQTQTRDVLLTGVLGSSSPLAFQNMSEDIKCELGPGSIIRQNTDVLDFNNMSEWFNGKSLQSSIVPHGFFNAVCGFERGTWDAHAKNTKYMALDGYITELYNFRIDDPLVIRDEVLNAVPSSWNPSELARFIEKYGTHIIVEISIGGLNLVHVRQDKDSTLEPFDVRYQLDKILVMMCTEPSFTLEHRRKIKEKNKRKGITVTFTKIGGDVSISDPLAHEWERTIPSAPAVVGLCFVSIKSFLEGLPGRGILSHAIDLYRQEKPPAGDLESFFAFQAHKVWTPAQCHLPAGMGHKGLHIDSVTSKLFVNPNQVVTGGKPVTGMRLILEGTKGNRLGIHLQHLSNISTPFQNQIQELPLLWTGSYEVSGNMHVQPIKSRLFSHVCTAPVVHDPAWIPNFGVDEAFFIVTGAQLHIQRLGKLNNVLHLRLPYSGVVDAYCSHRGWAYPSDSDTKCHPGSSGNGQQGKLLKYVDVGEVCRGLRDNTGSSKHCFVTGAKLDLAQGKVCLRLHFSLMSFS